MSDPDYREPSPHLPPPPPQRQSQPRSQVQSDELYARQLAAHYQTSSYEGYGSPNVGDPPLPRKKRDTNLKPNELHDDKEYSFFDGA